MNVQKPYVVRRKTRRGELVWAAWSRRNGGEFLFYAWRDAMSCALDENYPGSMDAARKCLELKVDAAQLRRRHVYERDNSGRRQREWADKYLADAQDALASFYVAVTSNDVID